MFLKFLNSEQSPASKSASENKETELFYVFISFLIITI